MRPMVPVRMVNSPMMGATYDACKEEIRVSLRTAATLLDHEMRALLAHENAHRNLYHCERAIGILLVTMTAVCYWLGQGEPWSALTVFFCGCVIHQLSEAMAEFEADYQAIRRYGAPALRTLLSKIAKAHPKLMRSPHFLLRLRFARWLDK